VVAIFEGQASLARTASVAAAALIRQAIIEGKANDLQVIRQYMPGNYTASRQGDDVIIQGTDNAGWTLDDYVIPRLASGLYFAREI